MCSIAFAQRTKFWNFDELLIILTFRQNLLSPWWPSCRWYHFTDVLTWRKIFGFKRFEKFWVTKQQSATILQIRVWESSTDYFMSQSLKEQNILTIYYMFYTQMIIFVLDIEIPKISTITSTCCEMWFFFLSRT